LLTYTAIGVAAFTIRTRPVVSILSLITIVAILFATLAVYFRRGPDRVFWIGFTTFSAGYFLLSGAHHHREFYNPSGALAEWLAEPVEVYVKSRSYDVVTHPSPTLWDMQEGVRSHVRFVGHCLTAIYLGVFGGYAALWMAPCDNTTRSPE
jgi:hypothetical protein